MFKKIQLLFILLFFRLLAFGQPDFNFRGLTIADGLPHNGVRNILQDNQGFIWFGTDNGICRYDGLKIKKFQICNDTVDFYVSDMNIIDRQLIIGTGTGLYSFNLTTEKAIQVFPGKIKNTITNISFDKVEQNIWVSTSGNGIFCISKDYKNIKHYETKIYENDVTAILADSKGRIWVSGMNYNNIVLLKEKGASEFKEIMLNGIPYSLFARVIYENHNGEILFGSWSSGIYELDSNNNPKFIISEQQSTNHLHTLIEYEDGQYLVGSDEGLLWYNTKDNKSKLFTSDNSNSKSLSSNFVYSLFKDREGGLWVGTFYGGVNYARPKLSIFNSYTSLPQPNSLKGNVISCFCEDGNHNIWIGSDDGGLNCMDIKTKEFTNYLSDKNIHALCCDGDDIWIGTYTEGIIKLNTKTKKTESYNNGEKFDGASCYTIFKDSKNKIWAASWSNLYTLDRKEDKFKLIRQLDGITYDIEEDRDGNLWIATQSGGLYCFNPDKDTFSQYKNTADTNSIPSNDVNAIFVTKKNNILIATSGGICSYDRQNDNFSRIYIPSKYKEVSSILVKDSIIWISTNNGISAYSKGRFQSFTMSDGLCNNQFLTNSGLLTDEGNIYFGSINGFCTFHPNDITLNSVAPKVAVTRFEVFNIEYETDTAINYKQSMSLGKDTSSFLIQFAALSYCMPEKNQYFIKIEGIDTDWIYNGTRPEICIKDIEPGDYVFCVKASNNDGIFGEETRMRIVIRENPFLSSTAICIYILITLGIAFVFWTMRKNNVRVRLMSDEEFEEEMKNSEAKTALENQAEKTPEEVIIEPAEQTTDEQSVSNESVEDDKEMLYKITKLIEDNITNTELTSTTVAEAMGFSRSSLYSYIKKITDKTPSELIQEVRLQKAYELLKNNPKMRINEAAYQVGFSNPSYFSKCFQKRFGIKPSEVK